MKRIIGLLIALIPVLVFGQTDDADSLDYRDSIPDMHPLPYYGNCLYTPYLGMGLGGWNLHQGLNGQISAGVNVGFGKNNPWKGASFFTSLAGLYVLPTSKNGRWTGAVGGYVNNFKMFGQQVNSAGVIGLVDYQINDRMSATGFLMHDFGILGQQKGLGMMMGGPSMLYGEGMPSTTLGGALNMKLGEKSSLSIGVSVSRYENNFLPNEINNKINTPTVPVRGARDESTRGTRVPSKL